MGRLGVLGALDGCGRRARIGSRGWLLLALLSAGCGRVTSVLLHLQFNDSLGVTQLQLEGQVGGTVRFGPIQRPDPAGSPLQSPQTLQVLVDDSLGGQHLAVSAGAWSSGNLILTGAGSVD